MTDQPDADKARDEECKKRGWDNGPGHCEGVAFCDGWDARNEEVRMLREALEFYAARTNFPLSAVIAAYATQTTSFDAVDEYTSRARIALKSGGPDDSK